MPDQQDSASWLTPAHPHALLHFLIRIRLPEPHVLSQADQFDHWRNLGFVATAVEELEVLQIAARHCCISPSGPLQPSHIRKRHLIPAPQVRVQEDQSDHS